MPYKNPEDVKAQSRRYYEANKAAVQERHRDYNQSAAGKAALARAKRKYHQTGNGKVKARGWSATQRERWPERHRAREALAYAVRSGQVVRPERCEGCRRVGAVEAHHHRGYAREFWLTVQWLCKQCHTQEG